MDTGHYHPTENVADKLSAVVPLIDDVLLHISRGLRWDSDHVLIQGDDLSALMQEMKRGGFFHQVGMGLDYFDASINRVAAWVIGLRARRESHVDRPAGAERFAGAGRSRRRFHRSPGIDGGI